MQRKLLFHSMLTFVAAVLVGAFAPAAQAVTIDAYTDLFPQNPDITAPGYNLIFVGSMCDGGACPPGMEGWVVPVNKSVAHESAKRYRHRAAPEIDSV